MTRLALSLLTSAAALFGGTLAWDRLGLSWWAAVGVVACVVLVASAGLALARIVFERRVRRRQGSTGVLARGLAAAATVDRVARGRAGFTEQVGGLLALERAVLLLPARGPVDGNVRERLEQAVRSDLARSSPRARAMLVAGLRDAADAAVEAVGMPLHPLHPVAHGLLAALGLRDGARLTAAAQKRSWSRRRASLDPLRPAEALAARLLAAGLERAALTALRFAPPGVRARRLRRLARCRTLLLDAAKGSLLALSPASMVAWREELLLLAGRRLPELVPGSALLRGVPGGAAALERTVARTPVIVAELAALLDECPELERPVATVLARIVGWPVGAVVGALREGTLTARPDAPLRSHLRGLALLEERRLAEAGAEFETALVHAPDFGQAAYSLATTKRRLGHVAAGEAVLRTLADRRPRDPEPLLHLARYLASVGERERARSVYETAAARFPDCVPLRVAFAQDLLAWGRSADAAEQLARAREEAPDEPRLALFAGRTLAGEIRLDEAAQALELAARGLAGAERAEAWFWLMNVRRDQGDHTTAQRIARRLLHTLGPGQSAHLDDVADYFEERQDYVRAREATERARRLRERGAG
jgi:tetratricopeptide (TPR) repeat protein